MVAVVAVVVVAVVVVVVNHMLLAFNVFLTGTDQNSWLPLTGLTLSRVYS